jgi:hypothetical protein
MMPYDADRQRGRLCFLSSQPMGRIIRDCKRPLIGSHRGSAGLLTPIINQSLVFQVPVLQMSLLWTDAMYEPLAPVGMGFVPSSPSLSTPLAGAAIIPTRSSFRSFRSSCRSGMLAGFFETSMAVDSCAMAACKALWASLRVEAAE